MGRFLKYLDPRTYRYVDGHEARLRRSDASICRVMLAATTAFMAILIALVLMLSAIRYESGADSLPGLIVAAVLGLAGAVMPAFAKSSSAVKRTESFIVWYMALYFFGLSAYIFFISESKVDGLFIYTIYIVAVMSLLHINPIAYAVQSTITGIVTFGPLSDSFGSASVAFCWTGLLAITVCLSFYGNLAVHKRIADQESLAAAKLELETRLRRQSNKALEGARREAAIQENVIYAIADLVESRDSDTGTHIKATSFYVGAIARNLAKRPKYADTLTRDKIELLEKAAPMHDLGKIMIPDDILKAPRRLTDSEFELMKQHTVEGARIVRQIYKDIETPEYIECAANVALRHHERFDGKGYPDGVSGSDIPLEARIMSVADVFDALVSKRCYKDAFPLSEAFEEIRRNSGTQFDPDIAAAFLESKDDIEDAILANFKDCE